MAIRWLFTLLLSCLLSNLVIGQIREQTVFARGNANLFRNPEGPFDYRIGAEAVIILDGVFGVGTRIQHSQHFNFSEPPPSLIQSTTGINLFGRYYWPNRNRLAFFFDLGVNLTYRELNQPVPSATDLASQLITGPGFNWRFGPTANLEFKLLSQWSAPLSSDRFFSFLGELGLNLLLPRQFSGLGKPGFELPHRGWMIGGEGQFVWNARNNRKGQVYFQPVIGFLFSAKMLSGLQLRYSQVDGREPEIQALIFNRYYFTPQKRFKCFGSITAGIRDQEVDWTIPITIGVGLTHFITSETAIDGQIGYTRTIDPQDSGAGQTEILGQLGLRLFLR